MRKRTNASLLASLQGLKSQTNQLSFLLPSSGVTFEDAFLIFAASSKQTYIFISKTSLDNVIVVMIFPGRLLLLFVKWTAPSCAQDGASGVPPSGPWNRWSGATGGRCRRCFEVQGLQRSDLDGALWPDTLLLGDPGPWSTCGMPSSNLQLDCSIHNVKFEWGIKFL